MKISRITVSNYRNIDGITVVFHPESNYIIGENNIGKSNFLSLLSVIFDGKCFDESDFDDVQKPIEIQMELKLEDGEQGFFGDNFSPKDSSAINIKYVQSLRDAYPIIVSTDTNESITPRQLRKINHIKYDTTVVPSKELRLNNQKGIGILISSIIERYNSESEHSYLDDGQISGLSAFINGYLEKIKGFKDYSIIATISPHKTEMLTDLFYLSDGDRKIDSTGSGVQYMSMASVNILCQISALYKSKSISFSDRLYTDSNGKKLLPIVLSVDEPEVHLHPYLQRSLIGYYKRILKNEDDDFKDLLKSCFGIDGLSGQLLIVTHSTDALMGDYRNLIRFYKSGDCTKAISGYSLRPIPGQSIQGRIKTETEKHLIMRFPEIKEAFYSKCVILIEGETEYGCIHDFALKKGVSLDDSGICVINAKGEGSIKPLRELLNFFAIPSIAIYNGDVNDGQSTLSDEYYTNELCFEIEIVKTLFNAKKTDIIRKIVSEMDSNAASIELDTNFVRKHFLKMGVDINTYVPKKLNDVSDEDENDFTNMFSAWFMAKKGVLLGRIVGDLLSGEDIPSCYGDAILKAQEVASNA